MGWGLPLGAVGGQLHVGAVGSPAQHGQGSGLVSSTPATPRASALAGKAAPCRKLDKCSKESMGVLPGGVSTSERIHCSQEYGEHMALLLAGTCPDENGNILDLEAKDPLVCLPVNAPNYNKR